MKTIRITNNNRHLAIESSTQTLFILLAMIALLAVQSSMYFAISFLQQCIIQWQIRDFSGGTNSRERCTNLSFCKIFDNNCMKMNDFEPRAGAPSLDPLVLYKPSHSPTRMHSSRMRTTRSSSRWAAVAVGSPSTSPLGAWVLAWTRFPSTSQALPKKLHEIE